MKGQRCNSITLEGIDRLGKSTQTKLVVEGLKAAGHRVTYVKSPYNEGLTFPLIYWMLGNGLARKFQNVFQIVHFINKLYFQWFVLPRLLRENDFIVFDRWTLSMYAYGVSDGASQWLTEKMLSCISEADYTIILDGDPHITTKGDSYENDRKYQSKVRSLYMNWAVGHSHGGKAHCCVGYVNANQPVQTVFSDIQKYLNTRFWNLKK